MIWMPKQSLGHLISRAARLFLRVGDGLVKPLGIAPAYVPIFAALKDGAALSQMALARIAQIEQPTMAATLSRMGRDGLILRHPDPSDGRSSLISLTPLAVAKIPRMGELLARGNEWALEGFDDAEKKALAEMLLRIIVNLEEAAKREDSRIGR